jgi:hypothetical protein
MFPAAQAVAAAPRPQPAPVPPEPSKPASPPPKQPTAAPKPAPLPPPPPVADEDKFEVVEDEPKPKSRKARKDDDDDDDDDSPRRRTEYDDRPRGRRRRNRLDDDDEDEDGEDDRPRRNRRRRDDEDDEDDRGYRNRKRPRDDDEEEANTKRASPRLLNQRANGRVGMLLMSVSSWLYFGLFAVLALLVFIELIDVMTFDPTDIKAAGRGGGRDSTSFGEILAVVTGIVGLAVWIVSLIAFAFCIAGPDAARVPAIATTVTAGTHLLIVGLCAAIGAHKLTGSGLTPASNASVWGLFATNLLQLDQFLPNLFWNSKGIKVEYLLVVLAGGLEVARLFMTLWVMNSLGHSVKSQRTAGMGQVGVVTAASVLSGGAVLTLLLAVVLRNSKFTSFKTISVLVYGWLFLLLLAYAAMLLFPALAAQRAAKALRKQSR